jgi:hypothetical protein
MNFEGLLAWMGHLGEGSWESFRRAVAYYAEDRTDAPAPDYAPGRARRVLSDLGHAQFFAEDRRTWRVFMPTLARLPNSRQAVLCGARNPQVLTALQTAASSHGCEVTDEDVADGPRRVALTGDAHALQASAESAGVRFVDDVSRRLAASLVPIPEAIESGMPSEAPINWAHTIFDFDSLAWSQDVTTSSASSAHEYRSRYGVARYLVQVPERGLVALDRRTAIYAAAFINSIDLAQYDAAGRSFSTPLAAPLPDAFARAATLCSGRLSTVSDGRITYLGIQPQAASILAVASGGRYCGAPTWFDEEPSP